jgi:hypothetical protein
MGTESERFYNALLYEGEQYKRGEQVTNATLSNMVKSDEL